MKGGENADAGGSRAGWWCQWWVVVRWMGWLLAGRGSWACWADVRTIRSTLANKVYEGTCSPGKARGKS